MAGLSDGRRGKTHVEAVAPGQLGDAPRHHEVCVELRRQFAQSLVGVELAPRVRKRGVDLLDVERALTGQRRPGQHRQNGGNT